jgi:flagellar basal body L-ring protein FlgH
MLERSQRDLGYAEQKAAIAPLVDEVLSNGVYEIVGSKTVDAAAA